MFFHTKHPDHQLSESSHFLLDVLSICVYIPVPQHELKIRPSRRFWCLCWWSSGMKQLHGEPGSVRPVAKLYRTNAVSRSSFHTFQVFHILTARERSEYKNMKWRRILLEMWKFPSEGSRRGARGHKLSSLTLTEWEQENTQILLTLVVSFWLHDSILTSLKFKWHEKLNRKICIAVHPGE